MRKFAVAVALVAMSAPADAVFFTYSQWEALPPIGRASYISGLYDGLVSFAFEAWRSSGQASSIDVGTNDHFQVGNQVFFTVTHEDAGFPRESTRRLGVIRR